MSQICFYSFRNVNNQRKHRTTHSTIRQSELFLIESSDLLGFHFTNCTTWIELKLDEICEPGQRLDQTKTHSNDHITRPQIHPEQHQPSDDMTLHRHPKYRWYTKIAFNATHWTKQTRTVNKSHSKKKLSRKTLVRGKKAFDVKNERWKERKKKSLARREGNQKRERKVWSRVETWRRGGDEKKKLSRREVRE